MVDRFEAILPSYQVDALHAGQIRPRRGIMGLVPTSGARRGHGMFRILYLVVLAAGLLWIVQTRPIWLDPTRAVEVRPRGAAADADWRSEENARRDEMVRRIKIVAVATVGVVVAGEIWCLLGGRLRLFHRI
jgi:hypothetical protein